MKRIWLHIVRSYLRIGLFFYYKRIVVVDKKNVPQSGSLLLVSNHNNALIDALLIATKSGRFSYFLTRASVFKKPMVNAFLRSLNMLPVYRIRDGWSTISNNNAIFNACSEVLSKGETVALFPEGNHNIKRSVRPLSKGFTRIVFETFETYPQTDLEIVPIGLNFQQADAFADSVSIFFGEPIKKQDYFSDNENERVLALKNQVSERIKQLTTHIPAENYEQTLGKLNQMQANFLNPLAVNRCIESDFKDCQVQQSENLFKGLKSVCKFLMVVSLLPVWLFWRFVIKPKIKEVEFVATFRFAIVITLVPLWLIGICLVIASSMGLSVGLCFLLVLLIIALAAVKL